MSVGVRSRRRLTSPLVMVELFPLVTAELSPS